MVITKGTPVSAELIQDLFKLDSNDRETCKRARLFLEAATEAIEKLRLSGASSDPDALDWPAPLEDFTEAGGFEGFNKSSVVPYIKELFDPDPEGLDLPNFYEEELDQLDPVDFPRDYGDAYLLTL